MPNFVRAAPTYTIQAAENDEIFIINNEKFKAKTYCFGLNVGDQVIFMEGSPYGACVSASFFDVQRNKTCEVWCESK